MRLRRLTLHHVRGVEQRTVDVTRDGDPSGVVIVEGPNEAGKSTLAFAFDQLLDTKASANTAALRSLRPADSDQPPRVEAELELGGRRFVYAKRWFRSPMTELRFLDERGDPTGEVLTGDEAHERVLALLDEHLDRALWSSLRLRQAGGLDVPQLDNRAGLTQVLEAAGDAGPIGTRESLLLQRAENEYLRYFSPKAGNPAGELKTAIDQAAEADTRHREVEARYRAMERDIAEVADLRRTLPEWRSTLERARATAERLQSELRRVTELQQRTVGLRQEAELAAQYLSAAQQAQEHRLELSREHDRLDGQRSETSSELDEARRQETVARDQVTAASEQLEQAQQRAGAAVARRQLAQDDLDHHARLRHAAELRDRFDRAGSADARAREAAARRDTARVDGDAIDRIRSASNRLEVARSALTAAVPQITLTARRQLEVSFGDETTALEAGAEQARSITETVEISVPDVLELEIRPGTSIEASQDAEREAREHLQNVLSELGQPSVDAAETAATAWAAAVEQLGQAEAERDAILGGTSLDGLRTQVQDAEGRVRAYLDARTAEAPLPDDEETAQHHLDAAKVAEEDATTELAEANRVFAEAKETHERCRQAAAGREQALRTLRENVDRLHDQLASARAEVSDAQLAERLRSLQQQVERADAAVAAAQAELDEVEHEGLDVRAANAARVAEDARGELDTAERRIGELSASIRALGADGIGEQFAEAEVTRQRAAAERDGVQRRADAARRLFQVLSAQRARAQERYAEPLKEKIVGYGRLVYGAGFDVKLNAQLAVTERRIDGLWLEVSALSVGAQEQLALLSRLACSTLLGDQGGVLLIDDALGNTDPQRLEGLGAAIHEAGGSGQIVIFTCYPQRYAQVGGARRVSLRRDRGGSSATPDPGPVDDAAAGGRATPDRSSAQETTGSSSDSLETLECRACGQRWTRPRTRGPKPRRCDACR